jgi:prophage regulatory protein
MSQQQIFLTDHKAGERYGVNRGTVWRWFNQGNFPAPVKLSPGCTRWRLSDLEAWENLKAKQAA